MWHSGTLGLRENRVPGEIPWRIQRSSKENTSSSKDLPAAEARPDRVYLSLQERLRRYKEVRVRKVKKA